MMRINVIRFFCVVLLAFVLTGCPPEGRIVIANNSHGLIVVQVGREAVEIGGASSGEFSGLKLSENKSVFQVFVGACAYTYAVPVHMPHFRRSGDQGFATKMQFESDFKIYLLPPDVVGIVPIPSVLALQQDGFPLIPTAASCR